MYITLLNYYNVMATSKAVQIQFSQNPKQKSVTKDLIEPQNLVSLWRLQGAGESSKDPPVAV